METIFFIAFFFVFYTYLGYPVSLCCLSIVVKKTVDKQCIKPEPSVSVVIAAKNEEKNIKKRIKNLLDQNYSINKLEIIIVSDGSNDNTNIIVQNFIKKLRDTALYKNNIILKLIHYNHSYGKPYALNKGVKEAKGKIIVFTDCRQRFSKDTIKHLVANFNDNEIGCASGELIFEKTPGSSIQAEMGFYWNFEKWLRKTESKTGSVPGATGAVYAIRRELFQPIPDSTLLDDVLIPLNICMQGYRTIFDGNALAYDTVSKDMTYEKQRKVRTLAGNWQLLFLKPSLINPYQNPLWIKFLSHKIFRLFVPYLLIIIFIFSLNLRTLFSNVVLVALIIFIILTAVPPFPTNFGILSKLSRLCKTVFWLNYFAFIAPFKLINSSKKLW